jgi:GNAT superfamily N-acetyltransferase
MGSVVRTQSPGRIRRNMPESIPVMVLGRLAVDKRWQSKGLGKALLRDAILRTLHVSGQVGARAILVHAISEPAKFFYKSHGFLESPLDPMTLFLPLQDAASESR